MNLIERLRREADADLFGETVCAEAADRIEKLEVELVDFKDSHADEWMKRKELEEDVAFYKARLDAVKKLCENTWDEDDHWVSTYAIMDILEQKDETN